jgi:hypothetical protein
MPKRFLRWLAATFVFAAICTVLVSLELKGFGGAALVNGADVLIGAFILFGGAAALGYAIVAIACLLTSRWPYLVAAALVPPAAAWFYLPERIFAGIAVAALIYCAIAPKPLSP